MRFRGIRLSVHQRLGHGVHRRFRRRVAGAFLAATLAALMFVGTPPASATDWPVIQEGSQGQAVMSAQYFLRHHGGDLEADGDFGPITDQAVRDFQEANGLTVDGVVGPQTWRALAVRLDSGATGDAVVALQMQLQRYGYEVPDDGVYESPTTDAVLDFKAQHEHLPDIYRVGWPAWKELIGGYGAPGSWTLPLDHDLLPRDEYDDPHHDYPAIDLPSPEWSNAWAVTSGDAYVFTDDLCGNGVVITAADGTEYVYCHFVQHEITSGPVESGQLIGYTGNTGNSTGPHLHFGVKTTDGVRRCPQEMLLAIYDGVEPPAPQDLPSEGCYYTSASPQAPLGP